MQIDKHIKTSKTYSIIADEEKLIRFIEWLPELKEDEMYQIFLFARKKYAKDRSLLRSKKGQLKRFTSKKEHIIDKIKQLEVQIGIYKTKDYPVPPESLVVYITLNPRSMVKAAKNSLIKLAGLITKEYSGYNTHQIVMSEIQRSCGTKHFVDFDIDNQDYTFEMLDGKINKESYNILVTRGGFHIIVEPRKVNKIYEKTWYMEIMNTFKCDVCGDNMIPIPGCYQGGFIPYMDNHEP